MLLTPYCYYIIAGSAGDPNAPQLIIENRAVTLEYARDNRSSSSHSGSSAGSGGGDRRGPVKTDWLCDKVRCLTSAVVVVKVVGVVVIVVSVVVDSSKCSSNIIQI